MKRSFFKPLLLALSLAIVLPCLANNKEIDLSGEWRFALDQNDVGLKENWSMKSLSEKINLPGSLQEQGKGDDVRVDTKWTGSVHDDSWYKSDRYAKYREDGNIKVPFWLNPEKHYVGVAWYQTDVDIPAKWDKTPVIIGLERTHWGTTLFVDGKKVGQNESLQVPHNYVVDGLPKGKHTITIRVDNRMLVDIGRDAHSVSDHTQSNWNGIIGKIKVTSKPSLYIDDVQIYPDVATKSAKVKVVVKGKAPKGSLILQVMQNGKPVGKSLKLDIVTRSGEGVAESIVVLNDDMKLWSEFTPNVYQMAVYVKSDGGEDSQNVNFGFRDFKANGTRFEVNGQQIYLRGTLECCIFPLTGYPAMTHDYWVKIYSTCKAFGLNHVRFHSWCPPKAAFEVADSMGMYLQPECGAWAYVGDGYPQDKWIKEESYRILKEYGNHPSFCMLSHGNEPSGPNQSKYLSELIDYWRSLDHKRRVYSSAGWPYLANADYYNSYIRIGGNPDNVINTGLPRTDYDLRLQIGQEMPTISHEIGQWCVYPNFKEIKKYTGVLKAKNFEIFQETLNECGLGHLAEKFLYASGRLQTLCYKMDIETFMRTPGHGGFQLLDLHDFPGQGTALIGVLDAFWDEKGYVTAKEYSTFCNATVPLVRFPKLTWTNNETLQASIEFSHFGEKPLKNVPISWTIETKDGKILKSDKITADMPIGNNLMVGNMFFPLKDITEPTQICVKVSVDNTDIQNSWNVWVYPHKKPEISSIPYMTQVLDDAALAKLNNGENVLLMTSGKVASGKGKEINVAFSPIFWNLAWSGNQPPHTLGIYCDSNHPALSSFPNDGYSDFQWRDVVMGSNAMIMDEFPKEFMPIIHLIDDWFKNRKLGILFETKVGKGKLMVCSADLSNQLINRASAAQFKQSILEYMASDKFNPQYAVSVDTVKALFEK